MKNSWGLLALILWAGPSLSYFKFDRPVTVTGPGQHYFVVDETIWDHALPDLADLRLYAGQTETPYTIVIGRGSLEHSRQEVPVLQQSSVGGKTQFLIDMSGIAVYDRVVLRLASKDFVAHAQVEGQDDPHALKWASLGASTLYDFSKERLGSNKALQLPRATYRYLRVTIDGPVKPGEVNGATSEVRQEQKPVWRDIHSRQALKGVKTLKSEFTFNLPANVPVERVVFDIDPAQPNFRREVEIQDGQGGVIGSGEIDRIHLTRAGRTIDSERQEVVFYAAGQKAIKVVVQNGDDPPLKINGVRLQQYERRIYFEGDGTGPLAVFYGDAKLGSPVYDYAKLFQEDRDAVAAQMGTETTNATYTGRPDERPWSEQHPAVLWIAIVAAVLVLGALALRSLKTASA